METEKLVSSLRIACHHPGGKNNKSPGLSVTVVAWDTACSQKSGNSGLLAATPSGEVGNTSTRDVLLNEGL